jgi:hypothetical protein
MYSSVKPMMPLIAVIDSSVSVDIVNLESFLALVSRRYYFLRSCRNILSRIKVSKSAFEQEISLLRLSCALGARLKAVFSYATGSGYLMTKL